MDEENDFYEYLSKREVVDKLADSIQLLKLALYTLQSDNINSNNVIKQIGKFLIQNT